MPITKERLIDLLNAGSFIETLYINQLSQISHIASEHLNNTDLPAEAREVFLQIFKLCMSPEYNIIDASRTIAREQTHWRVTHRRAERERKYKARLRQRHKPLEPRFFNPQDFQLPESEPHESEPEYDDGGSPPQEIADLSSPPDLALNINWRHGPPQKIGETGEDEDGRYWIMESDGHIRPQTPTN